MRDALNPNAPIPIKNANPHLTTALASLDRHLPPALHESRNQTMRNHITTTTNNHYAESNAQTTELTNLNLRTYGYTLPP